MAEDGSSRLDYFKTEGDVRVTEYRKGLGNAIDLYSINDKSFKNDRESVIKGAVRLLSGYDIDTSFIHHEERDLFALAVSDAWLSTNSIKEKRALLDILKLVATGDKEDNRYATLSGKVRIMSESGLSRGTMFDPEAESGNSHSEYVGLVLKYIEDNTETKLTEEVSSALSNWDKDSKLSHVRNKLGVVSQDEEDEFKVVVLNKTAQEMNDDLGYTSLFITTATGTSTVVFNKDYKEADSLEHEYAHSQSEGVNRWYQQLLFRGINKALTEGATETPQTYPLQREFLNKILEVHPEYEEILYKAYTGSETNRIEFFKRIIDQYGLDGFLTFARVAPIDNPKMSGGIGESIFLAPDDALALLSR